MSLGSLYLKLQQKFGHGLDTAYYRDYVRPKILETRPIAETGDYSCEIHVFTSARDFINLMWGLKSFYHYSKKNYALCIHCDQSIGDEELSILKTHFPQGNVVPWSEAMPKVMEWLKAYPLCTAVRKERVISVKEFDFLYYLNSDRMLLFDSDLLFFAKPDHLINIIDDQTYNLNSVNGDIETCYSLDTETLRSLVDFEVIERFNSGLGLVHKAALSLDLFESFLALPGILNHKWRFEQTLMALASCRYGAELLPVEYDVYLGKDLNKLMPMRHYVGEIRHLMYSEGMRQLTKQGFLRELT
ncbi:hypothetical protein [[Limnothrix rosea] IAM M-220]|uniref:hypothetical protein n=1 Tax=[Limnothrix rosea] IAM M-220 TaxID=454133 RepID=UPI00095F198B|nr:hypothetical protein [[Limnothrix rosea] IAM M-220]OKH11499.1 hypothetical protein NIES208_17225 [[Limnothrix rosea] IAM M-220]